jgi:L-asparaginase
MACDNPRLMTSRLPAPTLCVLMAAFAVLRPVPSPAQSPAVPLPLVYILATGGTISGKGASSTSLADYKSGALRGEDLVAAVPEIAQVARVKVEQIANISSTDITIAHWLTLARRINEIYAADPSVAGVVVTHGTNTIEETAYFLNLTVHDERPVVVVGSMRPASAISADGPLNLLNAVRAAIAKDAAGKGTLVVLNDEINAARDVTKTNTYRVETFRSGDLGLLGYVDADRVALYRAPLKRHTTRSEFDVGSLTALPVVDILYSYVAPSPVLAAALVAGGVRGIVVAGTGAGLMSTAERDAIKALAAGNEASRPIVVRSNRTGNGRVLPQADSDALGMVPADNLSPQKARILLMLALTRTRDLAEIRRMFTEY